MSDSGSGKTGAGVSRGPRIRAAERHGEPQPVGARSCRVRMSPAAEPVAVGHNRLPGERLLLPDRLVGRSDRSVLASVLRRRAGPQTAAPAPHLAGGGTAAQAPL